MPGEQCRFRNRKHANTSCSDKDCKVNNFQGLHFESLKQPLTTNGQGQFQAVRSIGIIMNLGPPSVLKVKIKYLHGWAVLDIEEGASRKLGLQVDRWDDNFHT